MPRARVVKPEFFHNFRALQCSRDARLLFIGMLCYADCQGVLPFLAAKIRMEIFPTEGFNDGAIIHLIAELAQVGLVASFEAEGQKYLAITGFAEHQNPRHPTFKYPPPPKDLLSRQIEEPDLFASNGCQNYGSAPVALPEHYRVTPPYNSTPNSLLLDSESQERTPSGGGSSHGIERPPKKKKGIRLPDDFTVPLDWIAEAKGHLEKHGIRNVDVELEAENFANYWLAETGARAAKADWRRAFLNWCVRASSMSRPRTASSLQFDHLQ